MIVFLKKVWVWIKKYWYIVVAVLALIVFIILGKDVDDSFMDIIERNRDRAKKEIETIEEYHKKVDSIKKHEKKKLDEKLDVIKKNKQDSIEDLEKKIKEKEKELREDPENSLKKDAEKYGWEYVE